MLTVAAIEKGKSFDGPKVRDSLEQITGFQGTTGVYDISAANHQGLHKVWLTRTENGRWIPEDLP